MLYLSPLVWSMMLRMIYGGHAADVWKLLDEIWPPEKLAAGLTPASETRRDFEQIGEVHSIDMTKAQFIQAFKARMRQSPYWQDLVVLNKGMLTSNLR